MMPDNNQAGAGPGPANHIRTGFLLLGLILGSCLLLSGILTHWDLDRRLTAQFHSPEAGWFLAAKWPVALVYRYGTIPGLLLTLAALAGWFVCLTKPHFRHLQRCMLVVVLAGIIGPGLIVNGIAKNYWSRPRPKQVQDFGGQWEYRSMFAPGIPGKGKSFPCGHCSMGFLFCALLAFKRKSPALAWAGGILGVSLGTLIGFARVVQGAHFPTDVIWSLGIVLSVIVTLYYLILRIPAEHRISLERMPIKRAVLLGVGLTLSAGIITASFMLHRPYFASHVVSLSPGDQTRNIHLRLNAEVEGLRTRFTEQGPSRIVIEAWGFGFSPRGVSHDIESRITPRQDDLWVDLDLAQEGYFAELALELTLYLPPSLKDKVRVHIVPD